MYWWFAYAVIKHMIMQIMIDLSQILGWPIRPYKTCLCTKFEAIWTNENRVTSKRILKIFYYVICENGLGAFSCPPSWLPQYKCMEIFKTLNSRKFCIYQCIDLKLAEIYQNGVIYIVLKFCQKKR